MVPFKVTFYVNVVILAQEFEKFIKRSEKKGQHKKGLHFPSNYELPSHFISFQLSHIQRHMSMSPMHENCKRVKRKENTKKISICIKLWTTIQSHFISFVPHKKAYIYETPHTQITIHRCRMARHPIPYHT